MAEELGKSQFQLEESVLEFWQQNKIFDKSLNKNDPANSFSFYDGPPFITGMPHYGTLLPSVAKDVIPRYQTMKGKYVRRVWGWDTHGLPAENQVEKQLGLKNKKDIEALGIDKFVEACREYVNVGSESWRWYIDHIGRWADIDNAYRTDNLDYMETVMYLFKELYDKGLIYQGRRVSLYCPRCATPLSKFEITMDPENYKDVEDPAITVAFKLADENRYFLAWTTTPWTLPANTALAIDKNAEYIEATDGKKTYILANLVHERYDKLEIVRTFKGEELIGKKYIPLYHYFETNSEKDYQVYAADFVTNEDGTGIVHIAPGFGEDDTKLGEENGLSTLLTLDDEGKFVEAVTDWAGVFYKKTNEGVMEDLQKRGLLFQRDTITHSYPHCYRCGTALIYKSQVSWYMKISALKTALVEQNKGINWIPAHFGDGRFAYNIENAPDWSISRTRYWGSPIPVWQTDDGETIVVGSIEELEEKSGVRVTDLHRPTIDKVTITLPDGRVAKRVPEVLDCWFESGAMPYAQFHYPFENEEAFKQSFPADFIVEYTGQLRGWFYYLHVLGNALFKQNAFRSVAVNGVIMGTDGKKMSKSVGNYPDPRTVIEKYGAEAMRLYFLGSKVMAGEDTNFNEEDIKDQNRLLQILHNSFRYYKTYAGLHNFKSSAKQPELTLIDRWILLRLEEFIINYSQALDDFDFVSSTRAIRPFIEDLSTWFIRRSRERFVSGDKSALWTLGEVLKHFAVAVAPSLPFSSEIIFRALTNVDDSNSVHLQDYPSLQHDIVSENRDIIEKMADVRSISSVAHKIRADHGISLRQPLDALALQGFESLEDEDEFLEILREELNVSSIHFEDVGNYACIEQNGKKVCLNLVLSDALVREGLYREILRGLQDARKKAGLQVGEKVTMRYFTTDEKIEAILTDKVDQIREAVSLISIKKAESLEDSQTAVSGLKVSFK